MRILVVHILALLLGSALCVEAQSGLRGIDRTAENNEEERQVVDDNHSSSSSTSGRFLNLMYGETPGDEDDTRYVVKVSLLIVIPQKLLLHFGDLLSRCSSIRTPRRRSPRPIKT